MCFCLLPVTGLNLNLFLLREVLVVCFWTILTVFGQFYTRKSGLVVVLDTLDRF